MSTHRVRSDDPTAAPVDTIWVNCTSGVAGDMLLAGLIDAGADRTAVMAAWAALDLGGFAATWERVERSGIGALWTNLVISDNGAGDGGAHEYGDLGHDHHGHDAHGHDAHRHDHHTHRRAGGVIELIGAADLPERVRHDAVRVYRALAAVEADIHQQPVDEVELHEVGALDSILDIVGVCAALADLDIELLTYSPIGVGAGTANTAHGRVPHPAPATASLLSAAQAAIVGIDTELETATPTGAALLTVLGVPTASPPAMEIVDVGYGAGTANPAGRANVVQVVRGRRTSRSTPTLQPEPLGRPTHLVETGAPVAEMLPPESLVVVETNVDDVTGEIVAFTIDRLFEAGALDAWASPIVMKKGRPGVTVSVLCEPTQVAPVRDLLLLETGSLGARVRLVDRWAADRQPAEVVLDGHRIGVKIAPGSQRFKIEYDDAARAARVLHRPLREVLAEANVVAERLFDTAPGAPPSDHS